MRYNFKPSLGFSLGFFNLFNAPQRRYRGISDQLSLFMMQGTTMTAAIDGRF
jgi:hypothetical protein